MSEEHDMAANVSRLPAEAGTKVSTPKVQGTGRKVAHGLYGPLDTPEIRSALAREIHEIAKLEHERDEINSKIKARRDGLINRGLQSQGVKDAVRRAKMQQGDLLDYDRTYMLTRDVLGAPVELGILPAESEEPAAKDDGAAAGKH